MIPLTAWTSSWREDPHTTMTPVTGQYWRSVILSRVFSLRHPLPGDLEHHASIKPSMTDTYCQGIALSSVDRYCCLEELVDPSLSLTLPRLLPRHYLRSKRDHQISRPSDLMHNRILTGHRHYQRIECRPIAYLRIPRFAGNPT